MSTFVFVDQRVADQQALVAGLSADSRWIPVDGREEGLCQLRRALAEASDVASIRIVAHGRPGVLTLGAGELARETLTGQLEEAASIGRALAVGGDIQIYGCEVGRGVVGGDFVGALAAAFGAPVAASSAPIGHADLGGDWRLDVGELRTQPFAVAQWRGVLGLTLTGIPLRNTPERATREYRNENALAALRADGSAVTWELSGSGDDTRAVAGQLTPVSSIADPFVDDRFFDAALSGLPTDGDDRLFGTAAADTIDGGAGSDRVEGREGDDSLFGGSGDDVLTGDAGDDSLHGGDGNDTLLGGPGDDRLAGGQGADGYDGGDGDDSVSFYHSGQGAVVNLATGVIANDGWGNAETIVNVEEVTGSNYADRITFGVGDSSVHGYGGNDTLIGNAGDDKFTPGSGADSIAGGDGDDEVAYSPDGFDPAPNSRDIAGPALHGLIVNMQLGTIVDGWGATDRVSSIEFVTGTDFADLMIGDANGNDFLGDPGNDTLIGGAGNDTLQGGQGVDQVDGGEGRDLLLVWGGTQGAVVNVGTGVIANDGFGNAEAMVGIEDVFATNQGDHITLGASGGTAYSMGGDDTLVGGAGADEFFAGSGADRIDGGGGFDVLNYFVDWEDVDVSDSGGPVTHGIVADLAAGAVVDCWGATDTMSGIEGISGSRFADHISGDGSSNALFGAPGDDTLFGGGGNDTLDGGKGNDALDGGEGNDTLNGGTGNDVMTGGGGADRLIGGNDSDTYRVDHLRDLVIETNATASSGGTDLVRSYLASYTLPANVENGQILATGAARISGNGLANVLYAGVGANVLAGGAGSDTVSWAFGVTGSAGVTASLVTGRATGSSGNDSFTGIENLTGSSNDDTLTGNSSANFLRGGSGNDILNGGLGNDTLDGGSGRDTLNGGADADRLIGGNDSDTYRVDHLRDLVIETNATASSGGTDLVRSYLASYTLPANVENGQILATGAARLSGNGLANVLYAGVGANVLAGGAGTDTVSWAFGVTGSAGVVASLKTGNATGGSGNDRLTAIENLSGSSNDDTLTGSNGANILDGGSGNDTLAGGNGNDLLIGGSGNDVLTGGAGADFFRFDTLPQSRSNRDRVSDFTVVDDTIQLENTVFSSLGNARPLAPGSFISGPGLTGALDSDDYLIYNTTSGALYYGSTPSAHLDRPAWSGQRQCQPGSSRWRRRARHPTTRSSAAGLRRFSIARADWQAPGRPFPACGSRAEPGQAAGLPRHSRHVRRAPSVRQGHRQVAHARHSGSARCRLTHR